MLFSRQKILISVGFVLTLLNTPLITHAADLKPVAQAVYAPMAQVSLPNIAGGSAMLEDYRGQVVLVDFWASWCVPCRQSFPWMNRLQQQYGAESLYGEKGLKVVAINLDQDAELAREFLEDIPAQFTVLLDTEAQLPEAYGVIGMPSSYLIDRSGKIRAQHIGFHQDRLDDYEDTIKTLLAE